MLMSLHLRVCFWEIGSVTPSNEKDVDQVTTTESNVQGGLRLVPQENVAVDHEGTWLILGDP